MEDLEILTFSLIVILEFSYEYSFCSMEIKSIFQRKGSYSMGIEQNIDAKMQEMNYPKSSPFDVAICC